jgi:glycosyltransferase involved in cell wall biosynthesis
MNVSIIVIAYNEENNIAECIESIISQKYDFEYELLIVNGNSQDKTAEIVKKYIKKHKNIRLMQRDTSSQSKNRNYGIKKSKYDYVAFTDADCIVPTNWLKTLSNGYVTYQKKDKNLAGVGGANIPPKDNNNKFLQAVGIAFSSWIGSLGSIQARPLDKDAEVFSVSCTTCLYKKSALIKVGLFPEYEKQLGDDWIMGLKLKKDGNKLVGLKNSVVWHKMRPTPKKFWDNMVLYGIVRMHYIKKYFSENRIVYFLPLIFLFIMLSSTLFFINKIFFLPLIYFPIIFIYSFYLSLKNKNVALTFRVFSVFIILHFGYSIGELIGIKWFFHKN